MLKSGFKTCPLTGKMPHARKRGLSGLKAHPAVQPPVAKKRKSRQAQAVRWLSRIARQQRLGEYFPLRSNT